MGNSVKGNWDLGSKGRELALTNCDFGRLGSPDWLRIRDCTDNRWDELEIATCFDWLEQSALLAGRGSGCWQ